MAVREIRPGDYNGVNVLWESVWWPTRSQAGWRWLEANPVLKEISAPQGWIHQDEQGVIRVVLGAMAKRFWRGDERFFGLTGHSLVVSPKMRGASRHMLNRIIAQPGFFACYTLNANVLSHCIYGRFGFITHPPQTAHIRLAWIIDPAACLMGNVLRRGLEPHPKLARRLSEHLLPARLWQEKPVVLPVNVSLLEDFDEAYNRFWQKLKGEGRLIADRGPEIQRWRQSDPDQNLPPLTFKYERDGEIAGYACAMFAKENPIEPVVLEIIDLIALTDAPEAVPALMAALIATARMRGAAKLRLAMVNPHLMAQLGPYVRSARREGGWAHAHVRSASGNPDIADWAPTPFDGDLFMTLRTPPRRAARATAAE
jgi:hypothetical protein